MGINELVLAFARKEMLRVKEPILIVVIRLAQALEKRNTYSALSKDDKNIMAAHSRGLKVLNNVTFTNVRRQELYKGEMAFRCNFTISD